MAHYDLYNALGLDRSQDSATLAQQIDQKINSGVATNLGGPEELRIARNILGNDQRRSMYDSKLNDPSSPDINIAALRDLANLNVENSTPQAPTGPAGASPAATPTPSNPQFANSNASQQDRGPSTADKAREGISKSWNSAQEKLSPVMSKTRSEFQRSSKGIIAITALATVLVIALIAGIVALVSWLTSDERQVKSIANEFLQLRTTADTETWLADNAFPESRNDLVSGLKLKDDYAGVDNLMEVSDPQAGTVYDFYPFLHSFAYGTEEEFEELFREEDFDKLAIVTVNDKDGEDTPCRLWFVLVDNDWKLGFFEEVPSVTDESIF